MASRARRSLAEGIAAGDIDLTRLEQADPYACSLWAREQAEKALDRIRDNKRFRNEKIEQFGERPSPLLYAIVATGNPMVFAPWAHDHHCDHEACGNAALLAGARTGATTCFGLFWTWTHTEPSLLARHRLIRLALTPATRSARLKAMEAHCSQVTDEVAPRMLAAPDLEPLQWPSEYYVTTTEP